MSVSGDASEVVDSCFDIAAYVCSSDSLVRRRHDGWG